MESDITLANLENGNGLVGKFTPSQALVGVVVLNAYMVNTVQFLFYMKKKKEILVKNYHFKKFMNDWWYSKDWNNR